MKQLTVAGYRTSVMNNASLTSDNLSHSAAFHQHAGLGDHAGAQRGAAPGGSGPACAGPGLPGEARGGARGGPRPATRPTRIARELAAADPRVTVVDNPSGRIPAGNNAAIKASRFPVVARVDGHALLPPGYLKLAVQTLAETGADNVGGIMAAEGVTPFEQAVAWAMTSAAGVGRAAFHTGGADRAGGHGLPRRVPAGGAGAGGRLRRGLPARRGLGDEPPDPPGGRAGLVRAPAPGDLPAPRLGARAGRAVLQLRPLAPGGQPGASGTVNLRYLAPPAAVLAMAAGLAAGAAGLAVALAGPAASPGPASRGWPG